MPKLPNVVRGKTHKAMRARGLKINSIWDDEGLVTFYDPYLQRTLRAREHAFYRGDPDTSEHYSRPMFELIDDFFEEECWDRACNCGCDEGFINGDESFAASDLDPPNLILYGNERPVW